MSQMVMYILYIYESFLSLIHSWVQLGIPHFNTGLDAQWDVVLCVTYILSIQCYRNDT